MIPVAEAQARVRAAFRPLAPELVSLAEAHGRVLAEDLVSRRTQPPFAVSAMDGYAVRGADVAVAGARLKLVGYAPAGARHHGTVGPGEAVRIFTGAPLPAGTDTIVIQEDTAADGDMVEMRIAATEGRHVRREGLDFVAGETVLRAGTRLGARQLGLAAAMNRPWLNVRRRPRVAILPTGDEVALPGEPIGPDQIVSSNGTALAAIVAAAGGIPIQLGVAPDDERALLALAEGAAGTDLLVTSGGASVGDHDLVRKALGDGGLAVDFWQIAMRPGKPLMFGRLGQVPVLGLPGNPVSVIVCSLIFLVPALEIMQGMPGAGPLAEPAVAGLPLPANDRRQDYLRAVVESDSAGRLVASAASIQDSSMMSTLAGADGLIVRPPHAPAAAAGDPVSVIRFATGALPI
ncbi:MAG TPA: gephyrin-like molybdotransferase Glp [Stellaceae bacterium]|nr:gephyrin-like molybdotransferase Glp [Stellaceae bacterium]